jgi:hypothetical protein
MAAKAIILKIRSHDRSDLHMHEKSIGMALEKQITARGGKCIATWADGTLTVFITGVEKSVLQELLNPFIETSRKHHRQLDIVESEQDLPLRYDLPESYSGPGSLRREKLTRKLILELPSGAFVVSNCYSNLRSVFAEKMGPPATRLAAWNRAVAAGAAQRLCQVLWNEEEFITASSPNPDHPL